jgi:hypothetical protein
MIKLISIGNTKIAKNTAIFNLNSGTDCPMKNECVFGITKKCYALKAENFRKQVLPYRRRQETYWNNTGIDVKTADFLDFFKRKKNIKFLRINEAGEVRNAQDLKDLDIIAAALKAEYGIKTFTYTHNLAALTGYSPKNITVNVSIDSGNSHSEYAAIAKDHNTFIGVVAKTFIDSVGFHCPGKGCMETCKRCAIDHKALTVCKIH